MDNEQYKIAHLNMVQNVINRMGNNCFLIKGWAITLLSALLTVLWEKGHLWIMFIPLILFWYLDSFYLRQERLYRNLYNKIIAGDQAVVKYSLCTKNCENNKTKLQAAAFSRSIAPFYVTIAALPLSYCLFSLLKYLLK